MNDLNKEGLKGRVKSLDVKRFEISGGIRNYVKGKLIFHIFKLFDEKGNYLEYSRLPSEKPENDIISHKEVFLYDEKGNLDEVINNLLDGSFWYKTTFLYDEKGNNIEEITKNIDNKSIFKNTFDRNSNMILKEELNSDDSRELPTSYKYDEKGNLIEQIHGYSFSRTKETWVYDDRGLLIDETHYSISEGIQDEINYKNSYKYDIHGRLFQRDEYLKEYHEFGESTYEFGDIHTYEVKESRDEKDNWITRVDSKQKVIIRDIEYYS